MKTQDRRVRPFHGACGGDGRSVSERVETRLYVEAALAPGATVGLDHARAHFLRSVLRLKPSSSSYRISRSQPVCTGTPGESRSLSVHRT